MIFTGKKHYCLHSFKTLQPTISLSSWKGRRALQNVKFAVWLEHEFQPATLAAVQVSSRIWVLWGLIWQAPEATSTGGIPLFKAGGFAPQLSMYTLFFAWGVTEVLRYGFFAVKARLSSGNDISIHLIYWMAGIHTACCNGYIHLPGRQVDQTAGQAAGFLLLLGIS